MFEYDKLNWVLGSFIQGFDTFPFVQSIGSSKTKRMLLPPFSIMSFYGFHVNIKFNNNSLNSVPIEKFY